MRADVGLTKPERQLVAAVASGGALDLGTGDPERDDVDDADSWPDSRTIRAQLLADLLTGHRRPDGERAHQVALAGARIVGPLELPAQTLARSLRLTDCALTDAPTLNEVRARSLWLIGCRLPGLRCHYAKLDGILNLTRSSLTDELHLRGTTAEAVHLGDIRLAPVDTALDAQLLSAPGGLLARRLTAPAGAVDLTGVRADSIDLAGARIDNPGGVALQATGLRVERSLRLCDGFAATGQVNLTGSRIGDQLDCSGASVRSPGGIAVKAPSVVVGGAALLRSGFECEGGLLLDLADVDGPVELCDAKLSNPGGVALAAAGARIADQLLAPRLTAEGLCRIATTEAADIVLTGATLSNPGQPALDAINVTVTKDLACAELQVTGALVLEGAKLGRLLLTGATLHNPGDVALRAAGMTTEGDAYFGPAFSAVGATDLALARVGGGLDLGGCFDGRGLDADGERTVPASYPAIAAAGLVVGRHLAGSGNLTTHGAVDLAGAQIGGSLDLSAAALHAGGKALAADGVAVDGDTLLHGLTTEGQVDLGGSRTAGQVNLSDTTFGEADGTSLDFGYAQATTLRLLPATPPPAAVDLVNARVDRLREDPATWAATVRLRGFDYQVLDRDDASVPDRVRHWVESDEEAGYQPGVYDQLAAAYRRVGKVQAARSVALAKQRRRRAELNWPGKFLNVLFAMFVGYGYRTWLAACWLVGLLVVGTAVFSLTHPTYLEPSTDHPPDFQPLAYTIDVLVPVVDLGQQSAWLAEGPAMVCSLVLIALGWVLTTAVVAGLTNALRRD